MARHRWAVVGVWLAVTVAGAVFGGGLFDRLVTTTTNRADSESVVAQRRVDQLAQQGSLVIAVIEGREVHDSGLTASVSNTSEEIRAMPGVKDVYDLYTSRRMPVGADNMSTTVTVTTYPLMAYGASPP